MKKEGLKRYLVAVNVTEVYEVFATDAEAAENDYYKFDMFDRDASVDSVEEWTE